MVLNCYCSVEARQRKPFLESLFEITRAFRSQNLVFLGDFNETKSESAFVHASKSAWLGDFRAM